MPKERFHLFIADKYLKTFGDYLPAAVRRESLAFLIGSLSPDALYYDFPFFSQTPLCDSLHVLVERRGIEPVQDWLDITVPGNKGRFLPIERKIAWGLGFACHILTDAVWHPAVNESSNSLDLCKRKGLSFLDCHRLIECELEALWLGRSEEPGRYTDLLRIFRKDSDRLSEIASFYRQFLEFAGLSPVPPEKKILKCYRDQNVLLRLFANKTLGRHRNRLLDYPLTRYLGSLVTPARTLLPTLFSRSVPEERNLFSDPFMEKGFTSLATLLTGLAERLSQYLPG